MLLNQSKSMKWIQTVAEACKETLGFVKGRKWRYWEQRWLPSHLWRWLPSHLLRWLPSHLLRWLPSHLCSQYFHFLPFTKPNVSLQSPPTILVPTTWSLVPSSLISAELPDIVLQWFSQIQQINIMPIICCLFYVQNSKQNERNSKENNCGSIKT